MHLARTLSLAALFLGANQLQAQGFGIGNSRLSINSSCAISGPIGTVPQCSAPVNGVYSLTEPVNTPSAGLSATFKSSAQVGGPLKAAVNITNAGNSLAVPENGIARAAYYDGFNVFGANAPSTVRFAVSADGVGGSTSDYVAPPPQNVTLYAAVTIFNCGSAAAVFGCAGGTQSQSFVVQANTGFQNGFIDIPVMQGWNNLYFNLSAVAILGRPSNVPAGQAWSGNAFSDFSNTVNFTGLQLLDAQGNDITAKSSSAFASGATYAAVVTPEPRTWLLLAMGLGAIAIVSKKRRIED